MTCIGVIVLREVYHHKKNIKTNKKFNDITYCKYESRIAYRASRERIAKDNDNLYPPQRAVLEIHKQLLTSNFRPGHGIGTSTLSISFV